MRAFSPALRKNQRFSTVQFVFSLSVICCFLALSSHVYRLDEKPRD